MPCQASDVQPDQPDLDALADQLSQLTEAQAAAVIAKSRKKDTATRQARAADAVKHYLTGTAD
jgi:hypothetical protein